MDILITGVSGFIGNNLASFLKKKGYTVTGICHSRRPTAEIDTLVICDLAKDCLQDCLGNKVPDVIVHLAGQMQGTRICDYLDNTVTATRKLIDYAVENRIEKFVYISSISAYGETLSAVDEDSDRINPDDYGMTKYICERLLEDSAIKTRIVIRQPRTLGKGCDLSYPWLPRVAGLMLQNETINYMNPQLLYNNLLYVDDFSEFVAKLLEQDWTGFERFVLGAKDKMSIIQILECMKTNLKSTSELVEKKSHGRNKCYAIDTTKAQQYGFQSRDTEAILEQFCRDIISGRK